MNEVDELRLDLTLYHLRFFKTRALAQALIGKGRVRVNGDPTRKAARRIRVGDVLVFPQGRDIRMIKIVDLVDRRVSAPLAAACYVALSDEMTLENARNQA